VAKRLTTVKWRLIRSAEGQTKPGRTSLARTLARLIAKAGKTGPTVACPPKKPYPDGKLKPRLMKFLMCRPCQFRRVDWQPAVNRGRGCFFEAIWCLQAASWLSTASNLAASTALGEKMAHRRITAYRNSSQAQSRRLQRFVRRFFTVFMPSR